MDKRLEKFIREEIENLNRRIEVTNSLDLKNLLSGGVLSLEQVLQFSNALQRTDEELKQLS